MDPNSQYTSKTKLLVRALPYIYAHDCFALKGGTALNLFVRDLPRLSVDIDLTYLPSANYEQAIEDIEKNLSELTEEIKAGIAGCLVKKSSKTRLMVSLDEIAVKIELSPVLRETVNGIDIRNASPNAEEAFGDVQARVLSFEDLYAGKICAALDRQHPRDLYDIKQLFNHEGLTKDLVEIFMVYLISGNRPIAELLDPRLKDIRSTYEDEFVSMTLDEVSVDALVEAREQLIREIRASITQRHKDFLLSFKAREPDWSLLHVDNAANLPAVKWKQRNLGKMVEKKHTLAYNKLKAVLDSFG